MPGPADLLTREFLAWVALRPRTYVEAMEAWRSSCPRLTIWEDSLIDGLIDVDYAARPGEGSVRLTPRGRAFLDGGARDETPEELAWEITDRPNREEAGAVDAGLDAFNRAAADIGAVRPLACLARLASGRVIGGAIGRSWGQCCEIQQIWVDESRRHHGVGSRIMRLVEDEARRRGCARVYLDTFTFQAPEFYRRLGYRAIAEIPGFPDGATKFIMAREL
jgi:GNAT superfamily N-acetyltransferase